MSITRGLFVKKVSVAEAKAGLSVLLNEVAYTGERVLILSRGKPKAVLISVKDLEELEEASKASRIRALGLADELAGLIEKRRTQPEESAADVLGQIREERIRDLTE
ncbi:MAG: type II toxin-antitoxin system Phd/YefM family antitoxin [Candidatus Methylomirabilales bacterium]